MLIAALRRLVTTAEKKHDAIATLCVVDPVARPVGQAELGNSLPHWFGVAGIAMREPIDPGDDSKPTPDDP